MLSTFHVHLHRALDGQGALRDRRVHRRVRLALCADAGARLNRRSHSQRLHTDSVWQRAILPGAGMSKRWASGEMALRDCTVPSLCSLHANEVMQEVISFPVPGRP